MEEPSNLKSIEKDGKSVFRLKNVIRLLSIVVLTVVFVLICIFGATVIANSNDTFPVRIDGDSSSITLFASSAMDDPTTHLKVPVGVKLDPMSAHLIPSEVDSEEVLGSHNGENYIAYSFLVRNNEKYHITVQEKINIVSQSLHADQAVRVRIFRDGVAETYAHASAKGTPEYGTTPFADEKTVLNSRIDIPAGETTRYTIVIWIEGDDPECINDIGGGSVRFNMEFTVTDSAS